ncbi:hypothetical protein EPN29_02800 [bacterium]|nr:MAG: hypothetical protein EPN29_02800 [bacterium]
MDVEPALASRESIWLVLIGCTVAVLTFMVIQAIPTPLFHLGRELELKATVQTYLQTGLLLVKPAGSGSWYTAIPGATGLIPAAWDDDPGIYVAASITTRLLGSGDPHRGLQVFMALLAALPWIWIPLTMGRAFRSFRAGVASLGALAVSVGLSLPQLVPFGTDYTAYVEPKAVPVYAEYGAASAWLVLLVTLLFLLWTTARRRPMLALALLSVAAGVGAGLAHGMRSLSGLVVIAAVGVLIFTIPRGLAWRGAAVAVAVLLAAGTVSAYTYALNAGRARVTHMSMSSLPTSHNTWHPLYLGLAYTGPGLETNPLGIIWDDTYAWAQARQADPGVVIGSTEYDTIIRHLYFHVVRTHPAVVAWMYVLKARDTLLQELRPLMAALAVLALVYLAGRRRPRERWIGSVLVAATLPGVAYGFAPPTLVMPLRYYFLELTASLNVVLLVGVSWLAIQDPRAVFSRIARGLTPGQIPGVAEERATRVAASADRTKV